jgi:hypothetical protein
MTNEVFKTDVRDTMTDYVRVSALCPFPTAPPSPRDLVLHAAVEFGLFLENDPISDEITGTRLDCMAARWLWEMAAEILEGAS